MNYRLDEQPGEWIDRRTPLTFRFEGEEYSGFTGDTLSSALAANGVRVLGRSFKYHRPRGILSIANHDCNALMQDATRLNIRADVTPLRSGDDFRAVNALGGLRNDRASIIDRFGGFLPVGFYYKAFHKPRNMFPFYERQMRAMAGLGVVDAASRASARRNATISAMSWLLAPDPRGCLRPLPQPNAWRAAAAESCLWTRTRGPAARSATSGAATRKRAVRRP